MIKENLIKDIKEIIIAFGQFGVSEVEADCSPCVGSLGNFIGLAEEFNLNGVVVNVYMVDGWINEALDEYGMNYEELDKDVLVEILSLCEQYKEGIKEELEINLNKNKRK